MIVAKTDLENKPEYCQEYPLFTFHQDEDGCAYSCECALYAFKYYDDDTPSPEEIARCEVYLVPPDNCPLVEVEKL